MYAFLFDIDGTLIHTGGAGQLAFAEAFAAEFGVVAISRDVPFAGRSDRAIAMELMRVHDIAPVDEHWQRFRRSYLERLPKALQRRAGTVLPGVEALLAQLARRADVVVGLLTGNIRAGADCKLRHYALAHHFDCGGFGDDAEQRSDIARQAVESARRQWQARTPPASSSEPPGDFASVIVIGDTPHDVRCARAIGAIAVAVATGGATADQLAEENPDLLLEDLSSTAELSALIGDAASRTA